MITLRLLQVRRHVYELRDEAGIIAEIAMRNSGHANVSTVGTRYELEALEGVRKRVVRYGARTQTVARSSSHGRFAVDLDSGTLYWHALPGPAATYSWMNGEGLLVVRYAPAREGQSLIQIENDFPLGAERDSVLIIGAYLLIRTWTDVAPFTANVDSMNGVPRHLRSR